MYYDYSGKTKLRMYDQSLILAEFHEAYSFRDQYMFGEQLLVSPILTPMDNVTMLSEKTVWLPPVSRRIAVMVLKTNPNVEG